MVAGGASVVDVPRMHPDAAGGPPRNTPQPAGGPTPPRRLERAAHRGPGPFGFALLSVLLGAFTGLVAVGFRMLIGLFYNLLYEGRLSWVFDTNVHAPPSVWGQLAVLVPPVAGLAVVFIVERFAPEARGHGVPEVLDAIYYQKGIIRPVVAAVKWVASALSIGSGGSVGREGPMIQVGAAFASWVGQARRVSRWQLVTLVAAGGGAGIAATFNTPIAGVLFAVEVLMHEVSVRTLVPVALATSSATYVARFFLGDHPAFQVPAPHPVVTWGAALLLAYAVLGCLTALVSALFIRSLYGAEDLFERTFPRHPYVRHFTGMLGVGVLGGLMMWRYGHYYVLGVGYATIMDVLSGARIGLVLLVVLFLLKLAATSLTLGSGASGGVFSPSLFMGATVGAAFGGVLEHAFPGLHVSPAAFALAGMSGVIAGATGAALTAIVMTFEMTLDYSVVLPMAVTVAASHGLRRFLVRESIYTMKLVRRGHVIPQALQANAHLVHHVGEMTLAPAAAVPISTPPAELPVSDERASPPYFVLLDGERVASVLSREWMLAYPERVRAAATLADLAGGECVTVTPATTIFDLLHQLQSARAQAAVVVEPVKDGSPRILGVVTMAHVAEVIAESLELFSD